MKVWPCGCYYDKRMISADEFTLNMAVCSECFEQSWQYLEELGIADPAQLTLPLPSSGDAPKC